MLPVKTETKYFWWINIFTTEEAFAGEYLKHLDNVQSWKVLQAEQNITNWTKTHAFQTLFQGDTTDLIFCAATRTLGFFSD